MKLHTSLRRRRNQQGSTLVESALAMMVFFMLVMGLIDFGQVLFLRSSIQERMRGALRSGAISYDQTAITNYVLYGTRTPASGATPSFNLTSSMVAVNRLDANTSADRIQITISNYPVIFYTPILARRSVSGPIVAVQAMETP
jgi:Flp pilus assembly protein TadG